VDREWVLRRLPIKPGTRSRCSALKRSEALGCSRLQLADAAGGQSLLQAIPARHGSWEARRSPGQLRCGLRRAKILALTVSHVQNREDHGGIVDLVVCNNVVLFPAQATVRSPERA